VLSSHLLLALKVASPLLLVARSHCLTTAAASITTAAASSFTTAICVTTAIAEQRSVQGHLQRQRPSRCEQLDGWTVTFLPTPCSTRLSEE
jgi:hypothetical protein